MCKTFNITYIQNNENISKVGKEEQTGEVIVWYKNGKTESLSLYTETQYNDLINFLNQGGDIL